MGGKSTKGCKTPPDEVIEEGLLHTVCGVPNNWQVVVTPSNVAQLPGQKNKASTRWLVVCMLNQKEIGNELGTRKRDV